MKAIGHFLEPRPANRAASCVHSLPGGGGLPDGTFGPVYLCPHSPHRHNVCLLVLTNPQTGQPRCCERYRRYVGHEEIPAEQC